MSFDSKYYHIAEAQLSERKARNDRLLAKNQSEIAVNYPEIAEIQARLSRTTSKIIQLIVSRSSDFEEKFGEIEKENLELQRMLEQSLVKIGKSPDYLDVKYTCKKCKDSGYYDGRRCECFFEAVKAAAMEDLNKSSPLSLSDFNDFSLAYYDDSQPVAFGCTAREIMGENLDFCRKYAEDFHLPCNGILMRGATGLGKTHLSLSIANEVIKKGYSVIYGSAPDLFGKAEQEHFGNKERVTLEMLYDADLLIMDDIGAEFESKFYVSLFYTIINNRMNSGKPTIVSTNLSLNDLLSRYGDRTVSRLKTMDDLPFAGTDVRLIRAREKRN
ncbi:MAG: ATP-binding protein [Ruminiclostridium sp.]|nr:ATP-binding protein [Ruminiclostridium sp.]MBQ8410440.1 ATP-binding protein [Ruminiclostridium sp.]MBQ8841893.1 ATP-binding protein [Ruminiclostridium sp.]